MKTYYTLFEGRTANDNDMTTEFTSKTKALKAFKASTYAYAVVHQYEGTPDDTQANYKATLAEKEAR